MNNSSNVSIDISTIDHESRVIVNYIIIGINAVSSLIASSFNFLVILAFIKTPSLRTPSFILILSLAVSDFGVGVISQPLYSLKRVGILIGYVKSERVDMLWVLSWLFTVTAINIDRYLAVRLRLSYQSTVTTKRSIIAIALIWFFSAFYTALMWISEDFFDMTIHIILVVLSPIGVGTNVVLIILISRAIHKLKEQAHNRPETPQQNLNLQRYQRSVNTMYIIMIALVVCYLPPAIATGIMPHVQRSYERNTVDSFATTLLFVNSSINPFIYYWRIHEIRKSVWKMFCCGDE